MASLQSMPSLSIATSELAEFGSAWQTNGEKLSRTPPCSSMQLGELFDRSVAEALAAMLGGIPIVKPSSTALLPAKPNCVELGPTRVIGGVRPQNFDVGYRPDGIRFAFDSKTLNDIASVRKNYQNMINDLATESTTVHSRFPYAVVAFLVAIPKPCLADTQKAALIETLERLAGRVSMDDAVHRAESIALVVWDPYSGEIDSDVPEVKSPLRVEKFSVQIERSYTDRYKGLPPHSS